MLIRVLALALLVAVAPSAALGQAQPKVWLGGGLTLPVGDVGESHGRGYNGGTRVSWPLTSYFAVVGSLEYRDVRRDDEATVARLQREGETRWSDYNEFQLGGGFLDGGHRSSLAALAHGQLLLRPGSGRVTYYLLAGGGVARAALGGLHVYFLGEGEDHDGESEVTLALDAGAGVEVQVGQSVGIFAQASHLVLLTDGASTRMIPIQLGLSFVMSDRFVR